MGLFDGLRRSANRVDDSRLPADLQQRILLPGERVEHAYKVLRDFFVFTNLRLVLVDKQGATGTKICYRSIPYKSITQFSIETMGQLSLDAEIRIWVRGAEYPVRRKFSRTQSIFEIQTTLAKYVTR